MATTDAPDRAAADPGRSEAFVGRVLQDTSGASSTILAALGDRLGLFRALDAGGPATSPELAARAGIDERYAREWLAAMTSAGYLEHDPRSERFALPPEHAPALAQEGGPFFFGGVHQMLTGMVGPLPRLAQAFREGGGVPQSAYSHDMWEGLERFTQAWFDNLLLPVWIPAMPRVGAALARGADVADVGCGHGRALVALAGAYPASRFTGFDAFGPAIDRARALADEAGVADRVRFEVLDASAGLPAPYDVVTTFDVVHDAVDPAGLLRAVRASLRPGGTYVCVDINCSDRLEENAGPLGALFFGFSIFYCMTTSLAGGGAGLGTCGFSEAVVRRLCDEAGFGSVRRLPLENPFNNVYEITPEP